MTIAGPVISVGRRGAWPPKTGLSVTPNLVQNCAPVRDKCKDLTVHYFYTCLFSYSDAFFIKLPLSVLRCVSWAKVLAAWGERETGLYNSQGFLQVPLCPGIHA